MIVTHELIHWAHVMARRHSTSSVASTDSRDQSSKRQKLPLVPLSTDTAIPKFLLTSDRETRVLVLGANPPLDFCLKQKIKFVSPLSFEWCFNIPSKEESSCLTDFWGTSHSSLTSGQTFSHSLLQFEHPANQDSVLTAILASKQGSSSSANIETTVKQKLADRWRQWEVAFRSLYMRFRNQQISHFYFDTVAYCILFVASSSDPNAVSAYISRATRSLRETLKKYDVHFTIEKHSANSRPFDENASSNLARAAALDEASAFAIVQGRANIHALVDVLLNTLKQQADDVPILRAPDAFLHCSLKPLIVSASKVTTSIGPEQLFGIEIAGSIMPITFLRLCQLFRSTQSGNFSARFKNDDRTSSFHFLNANLSAEQLKMFPDCCQVEVNKLVDSLDCSEGIFSIQVAIGG